ncbi:MAG: response regulator transcription factor [Bdellovibrionota bacterium]
MNKQKILIIDDEASVARFLKHSLEAHDFTVTESLSGKDGLQKVISEKPALIILDHGLPDKNGIEILKELRAWSKIPVIFLTVRDDDTTKVEALDNGADDYLTKPFSVPELLARIRVALRHAHPEEDVPLFRSGSLEIDRSAHTVRVDGREVKLTATEYSMLCLLAKHAGKVVPHRTILNEIWGPNSVEHNHYLRVYFGQVRKKLASAGELIENESGVGYRLKV